MDFSNRFLRLKLFKNAICFEQNEIGQKSTIKMQEQ